jgi:hypothetical protein
MLLLDWQCLRFLTSSAGLFNIASFVVTIRLRRHFARNLCLLNNVTKVSASIQNDLAYFAATVSSAIVYVD